MNSVGSRMRQIRTSGLMHEGGKWHPWPSLNTAAPFLNSTTRPQLQGQARPAKYRRARTI